MEIVHDPRLAVSGCDIVVTSGPILKTPHETIRAGWVDEGTFASLVDFDSYWSRNALNQADKWTTDHLEQYEDFKTKGGLSGGLCRVGRIGNRKKARQRKTGRKNICRQFGPCHGRYGCRAVGFSTCN